MKKLNLTEEILKQKINLEIKEWYKDYFDKENKTEQEYNAEQEAAQNSLYNKRLKVIKLHKNGEYYVSVIPDDNI